MNSLNNPQEIKVVALTEVFNADHRDKDNFIDSHVLTSTIRQDMSPNHGGVGLLIEKNLNFSTPEIPGQYIEGLIDIEGKTTVITT